MRSLVGSLPIALSAFAALLCLADPSAAQSSAAATTSPLPATDSIFKRARRLVSDGNGPAGRAVVDSMLRASSEGTPSYGDALFWRGALAETAADAERDYRRVVVEYPLSPYVDDALLSLAELEQARGDRAAAFQHLQRFVREHPASPARARAGLAAARLAFEQRDMTHGCSMIADARASVGTSDVELRNQIDYYGGRCPTTAAVNTASVPAAASQSSQASPTAASPTAAQMGSASAPVSASGNPSRSAAAQSAKPSESTPSVTTSAKAATSEKSKPSAKPAASAPLAMVAEAPKKPAEPKPAEKETAEAEATEKAPTEKESAKRETAKKETAKKETAKKETAEKKSAAEKPAASALAATKEHAPSKAPSAARGIWTIQLAAYNTRPDAEHLVKKLAGRGVQARVSGNEKPFRVRLDYYPTRQAAAAAVAELKQRGIIGFVTDEPRPSGATSP